jgi:hypothetical protein
LLIAAKIGIPTHMQPRLRPSMHSMCAPFPVRSFKPPLKA